MWSICCWSLVAHKAHTESCMAMVVQLDYTGPPSRNPLGKVLVPLLPHLPDRLHGQQHAPLRARQAQILRGVLRQVRHAPVVARLAEV
eukprot:CAMPEP_0183583446 /NCGR_PEP_ID=MMETSP0371-20130417/151678_1 /TAXON_ID=268820 /ORGANISM="Peridinium aciculiferum, Strain PAER-2" /LENGTH=87 /DNA_ID=CAMNT_0025794287 /DNA_START=9 /DNA_END=272 /DNA_ORIENTATION=+